MPDPNNPKTTRTFGEIRSVVEMPEYEPSPFVASAGALRGTLQSFTTSGELAWGIDGLFRFCGTLAPAITPTDFLGRLFDAPKRPVESISWGGTYDVRFIGHYHNALDAFRANGYRVTAREAPIGHSSTSWRHYLPEIVAGFFPPS